MAASRYPAEPFDDFLIETIAGRRRPDETGDAVVA
jgi:hypothetical protein